jgi:hypothetical protein
MTPKDTVTLPVLAGVVGTCCLVMALSHATLGTGLDAELDAELDAGLDAGSGGTPCAASALSVAVAHFGVALTWKSGSLLTYSVMLSCLAASLVYTNCYSCTSCATSPSVCRSAMVFIMYVCWGRMFAEVLVHCEQRERERHEACQQKTAKIECV